MKALPPSAGQGTDVSAGPCQEGQKPVGTLKNGSTSWLRFHIGRWKAAKWTLTALALASWALMCILDLSGLWWQANSSIVPEDHSRCWLSRGLALGVLAAAILATALQRLRPCRRRGALADGKGPESFVMEAWSPRPGAEAQSLERPGASSRGLERPGSSSGGITSHRLALVATHWCLLCGATAWLALHAANGDAPQVAAGAVALVALLILALGTAVAATVGYHAARIQIDEPDAAKPAIRSCKERQVDTGRLSVTSMSTSAALSPLAGREQPPEIRSSRWQPLFPRSFLFEEKALDGVSRLRKTSFSSDCPHMRPACSPEAPSGCAPKPGGPVFQAPVQIPWVSSGSSSCSGGKDSTKPRRLSARSSSNASIPSRRPSTCSQSGFSDVSVQTGRRSPIANEEE
ncbi:unnamed protein product [Polarella glacialis]|uniref:Uncharacterized protein n=1 Tax=Polarella glacialis TaxID=89957 RepID=A0A813ELM3_POLGL|nr:unnamed protein product [Polarella glacialis]